MSVLCISRQFGAGGKTLGEGAAAQLGYQFFHEGMLDELANKLNASGDKDWTSDQGVVELLYTLGPVNFIDRYRHDSSGDWDEKLHQQALIEVVTGLAEMGNVVVLGRGSQFVLREFPGAYRVLLVSQLEDRVKFISAKYRFDPEEAEDIIVRADKRRSRFLGQFYPGEPNESSLYHLVLNTSLLPKESAQRQMVSLVRKSEEFLAVGKWK